MESLWSLKHLKDHMIAKTNSVGHLNISNNSTLGMQQSFPDKYRNKKRNKHFK